MQPAGLFALVVALLCGACASESAPYPTSAPTSADAGDGIGERNTVVFDARVYTVDPNQPWAEAFAYDDSGVIIAVGGSDSVLGAAGPGATRIDGDDALVLPGFQDVHVHVPEAGLNANVCFIEGADLGWLEAQARDCAERQPETAWVRAAGPSLFDLRSADELPLDVLDRAIPDRPALILDDLGHAVWTNSLGLAAAGVTATQPDPPGGAFHRDPKTGRLTGLVLEDAQQLIRNAAARDNDTVYHALLAAMEELNTNGVTTISDAGGYWAQDHPAAWIRGLDEATLTVRAMNSLYVYPALDIDEQLADFERLFRTDSDMVRFDTAKIYIDGILDLGTALLLEPYDVPIDPLYPNGFRYFTPDQLATYVNELHAIGYRINFHVIGDAAVREALDTIESIDDEPDKVADRRHRTTHVYMVHPDDLDRFAQLGVVADFQQSADAIATDYHDYLSDFIGDRAFDLVPTAQLLDAGAIITLSSDWDAGPLPPLGTIERSLTRESNAVPDLETAIAAHTIGAAYALGHDELTGSIEVGKLADFVMLDQNLFEIEPESIAETGVLLTVMGGKPVHDPDRIAGG